MGSSDSKAFLETETGVARKLWKRRGKESDGEGGWVREFESDQGVTALVRESKKGKLSLAMGKKEEEARQEEQLRAGQREAALKIKWLDAASAAKMPSRFGDGCSQPTHARIWGVAAERAEGQVEAVFDNANAVELFEAELFIGPAAVMAAFVALAAQWIEKEWNEKEALDEEDEEDGQFDCASLCVWADGGPWSAAGLFRSRNVDAADANGPLVLGPAIADLAIQCESVVVVGHLGNFGCVEDMVQELVDLTQYPQEAAEAALLFAGSDSLKRIQKIGVEPRWPSVCEVAGRLLSRREAREAAQGLVAGKAAEFKVR